MNTKEEVVAAVAERVGDKAVVRIGEMRSAYEGSQAVSITLHIEEAKSSANKGG